MLLKPVLSARVNEHLALKASLTFTFRGLLSIKSESEVIKEDSFKLLVTLLKPTAHFKIY